MKEWDKTWIGEEGKREGMKEERRERGKKRRNCLEIVVLVLNYIHSNFYEHKRTHLEA